MKLYKVIYTDGELKKNCEEYIVVDNFEDLNDIYDMDDVIKMEMVCDNVSFLKEKKIEHKKIDPNSVHRFGFKIAKHVKGVVRVRDGMFVTNDEGVVKLEDGMFVTYDSYKLLADRYNKLLEDVG